MFTNCKELIYIFHLLLLKLSSTVCLPVISAGSPVGRMCVRIICTHHPRSLTHNSTMTSADGICLLPSMTDPSNLEPKDTGHRPCQRKMIDSSAHELQLNQEISFQNLFFPLLPFAASFPFLSFPFIYI